ncbi:MAG: biotin--[acetyl-CoA-carboxylase] ligase [Candidatus Omnitrophica bacterium]|nr:biotin--[acetyl-CoA-carboxylase] ligase [Candidatus Omnitrophota bacterium]
MGLDDDILDVLRENGGTHISGEELCKTAGVSRAAIWKHIEKLRDEGYDIEASPHLGYRLIGIPDSLIPGEIKWKLKTAIVGRKILSYRKVDSTNTIAYGLAEKGLEEGAVIIADEQTGGRGRQGRVWNSPPGSGIYMSIILRPGMAPNEIPKITLVAAVAVAKAVRQFTGLPAIIKWPNDILVNRRKVCGILTEMKAEQDRIGFIVLGIGVNVNTRHKDLPKTASSLKEELRRHGGDNDLSRVELVKKILEAVDRHYNLLKKKGSGPIIEEWKELSAMLGARIRVALPNRSFEAQAHDIDQDGSLVVRLDSGMLQKVAAGDVEMIR